jgi:hypothetical protein
MIDNALTVSGETLSGSGHGCAPPEDTPQTIARSRKPPIGPTQQTSMNDGRRRLLRNSQRDNHENESQKKRRWKGIRRTLSADR